MLALHTNCPAIPLAVPSCSSVVPAHHLKCWHAALPRCPFPCPASRLLQPLACMPQPLTALPWLTLLLPAYIVSICG